MATVHEVVDLMNSAAAMGERINRLQAENERLRNADVKLREALHQTGLFALEHTDGSFTIQKK